MTRIGRLRRTLLIGLAVVVHSLLACADQPTAPPSAPAPNGRGSAREASDAPLATVAWQTAARELVASHPAAFSPNNAARAYALLAVAQYGAVVAADVDRGRAEYEARRGAVGGASAQILAYLVPDAAATLEQQLAADGDDGSGETHPDFTRGVATGRAMADVMRGWALADGFSKVWDRVPLPAGPGLWVPVPNVAPAGFQFPAMRPYFLTAQNQFRPPPPPAFGSAAFDAEIAAVRLASDTRGPRETDIANFWNQDRGTQTTLGYWVGQAASLVATHDLDEREAAHVFALVNTAGLDAAIGCFEAKYHYLLLRPSQADPLITFAVGLPGRPFGLPNHPSYPANHSCVSAAAATVLGSYFPTHAAALDAQVREAGVSRIYGGIHYPVDIAAGEELGRAVARWAMAYDDERGLLAAVGQPAAGYDRANARPAAAGLRADPASGPYAVSAKACGARYTVCLRFQVADADGAADGPFRVALDWGDGSTWAPNGVPAGTSLLAPHDYAAPGRYHVTVTVTDRRGAMGTATTTLDVVP